MENNIKRFFKAPFIFTSIVLIIFILGFLVRLYRFNGPIADWHSWRQADTSAVSRIFVEKGFDILHPRYLDISNIQTGKNNPQGYRFVEFPIYNIFQAGLFKIIGFFTLEEWGRLISITSSLFAGLFIFLFSKKHFGKIVALSSLFFYLFIPFSIYYSRTILPDVSMAMASLGGIYFFDLYISKTKSRFVFLMLSTVFTALALLLKPYAIFFTLPQIVLAIEKYKGRIFLRFELYLHLILAITPLALWRIWMLQYPEGIPASAWLFNGNGIRFRPAFFRWILYERFTKLISGYFGIVLAFFGLYQLRKISKNLLPLSFLASSILYVCVFATGNVQHDYYQILIIPSIAILFGFGAEYLWMKKNLFARLSLFVLVILSFAFAWNQVKDYFNINNPSLVIAGKEADKILPKDAKVIAPYGGDTTFLYYINRKGWPAFQLSTSGLKALGATYMVIAKPDNNDRNGFGKKYTVVASSPDYLILKL